MYKISPYNIVTYMKCPKRSLYSKHFVHSPRPYYLLIRKIIQSVYVRFAKSGIVPTWKAVRSIATRSLEAALPNLVNKPVKVENLLVNVYRWYKTHLLGSHCFPGLVNLPLLLELGHSVTLVDSIPIVIFSENIELVDFKEVPDKNKYRGYQNFKVKGDFEAQLRTWAFWKCSNILPTKYSRVIIGTTGIKIVTVNVDRKMLENTIEPITKHVVNGIQQGIYYRSISEQCNSCPFLQQCQP